jgi:hypothetical protein
MGAEYIVAGAVAQAKTLLLGCAAVAIGTAIILGCAFVWYVPHFM